MNEYTITVYQSTTLGLTNGKYFWHMKHKNGKIVADSGEGYVNKADLFNELNKIKAAFSTALIVELT